MLSQWKSTKYMQSIDIDTYFSSRIRTFQYKYPNILRWSSPRISSIAPMFCFEIRTMILFILWKCSRLPVCHCIVVIGSSRFNSTPPNSTSLNFIRLRFFSLNFMGLCMILFYNPVFIRLFFILKRRLGLVIWLALLELGLLNLPRLLWSLLRRICEHSQHLLALFFYLFSEETSPEVSIQYELQSKFNR